MVISVQISAIKKQAYYPHILKQGEVGNIVNVLILNISDEIDFTPDSIIVSKNIGSSYQDDEHVFIQSNFDKKFIQPLIEDKIIMPTDIQEKRGYNIYTLYQLNNSQIYKPSDELSELFDESVF